MNKKSHILLVMICTAVISSAQKPPLDHSVYDAWKNISSPAVSSDGKWVSFIVNPQQGDGWLYIYNVTTGTIDSMARGSRSAFGGIRWESGMSRKSQYEQTQSRIGGTLWEKPVHFIENSPIFFVPKINTPLLLMHNDADGAVPWYQSIELITALRRLNKPAWLLSYNEEAHNLVKRPNRKDISIRKMQFFDHYLKGTPMTYWMKYGISQVEKGKIDGYNLVND